MAEDPKHGSLVAVYPVIQEAQVPLGATCRPSRYQDILHWEDEAAAFGCHLELPPAIKLHAPSKTLSPTYLVVSCCKLQHSSGFLYPLFNNLTGTWFPGEK